MSSKTFLVSSNIEKVKDVSGSKPALREGSYVCVRGNHMKGKIVTVRKSSN